jgi:ZIP family zinc transporter
MPVMGRAFPVLLACLPFFSTGIGGLAALRFRRQVHVLVGFSAGAVLGVVFFDLLPTVFATTASPLAMIPAALGFLAFHGLERFAHGHAARGPHEPELGVLAAAGLSLHSYVDGLAIGISFQARSHLALLIALAVIAHDFADGLNTVSVMLAHGNTVRRTVTLLLVDMTAPLAGAASSLLFQAPESVLPSILAFFAGSFLYLGASDLLPEAREHGPAWVVAATALGMAVLLAVSVLLPR